MTFAMYTSNGLDDFGQQLPRASDERLALLVFVRPGRFSHEHQIGIRVTNTEDHLLTAERMKLTAVAGGSNLLLEQCQYAAGWFSFFNCHRHH
jgi:hypothetical protein